MGYRSKNKLKNADIALLILGMLALLNIAVGIFRYLRGECLFVDFRARWQESAYLFRGINPFGALNGKAYIEEIGAIDPDMVTVPWAWLLGSIISPGFLTYGAARIWGMCMFFGLALVTAWVCCRFAAEHYFADAGEEKKKWAFLAALIVVAQYCWIWSFMCGNHGALACCFIVLAVCIYRERPVLAGVLMAFAMIKPQVAALFFITFLLLKQFKLIITSAVVGLTSMAVIYGITGAGIIELLKQTSQVGTNLEGVFFGLFNMLKYTGVSTKLILLMDIVIGVAYLLWLTLREYNNTENELAVFMGASIASTFWFYKQTHDYVILILPCMILLHNIHRMQGRDFGKRLGAIVSIIFVFYVQSLARKILCLILPSCTDAFSKELFMTFTCIFLMIMGVICTEERKKPR